MPCPLPADCLNEVFENLGEDKYTLHSCLLVNRLWCKISVRILWKNIWNFKYIISQEKFLSTLIACLPDESKELLHKNEISISTPTSNLPIFNYTSFCKILSIFNIGQIIDKGLKNDTTITSKKLIAEEILKMFMNQTSLKTLSYYNTHYIINDISFTYFPGAKDCLADLSELHCKSDIHLGQLSQICHNLQSLTIDIESQVSNGLKELISSQNNLKNLNLTAYKDDWADIIPNLTKHSNTLAKLQLEWDSNLPLSFVSQFLNLQEIELSFDEMSFFEEFKELQYATFPKLQTLKIPGNPSRSEYMIKFLEINGKNLKEFYIFDNASNLSIDKFCPNLKKLFTIFKYDDLDVLKIIFNSCQYLEGIVIWLCGERELNEKELLEAVAEYSPKNFYELKLLGPNLFPEDLESFLIRWNNRTSKKSLSLIIIYYRHNNLLKERGNMKIIDKYINLGIIKKFETGYFDCGEIYYL